MQIRPPLSHPMGEGHRLTEGDRTQCHRRTNPGICALRGKIYFHDGNAKSRPLGEGGLFRLLVMPTLVHVDLPVQLYMYPALDTGAASAC